MTSCVMGYDGNCQHIYTDQDGILTVPTGEHIASGARVTSPLKPTTGQSKDCQCPCHGMYAPNHDFTCQSCREGKHIILAEPQPNTGQSKDGVVWINWAVHQLDDMEMNWPEIDDGGEMVVGWRAWKHLRGSLRERFKEIYGVDPSPHYNPGAATQALSSAKASGNDTEPLPPQPNTGQSKDDLTERASSGFFAADPEARRAKWADPDRTRLSLSDADYRKKYMEPQSNTDSLDIAETLAYHLDGSTEQPGFTDAVEALEQLFNKYAMERELLARVDELQQLADFFKAHHLYDQDAAMKLRYHINERIAELKEQRAKLKEYDHD